MAGKPTNSPSSKINRRIKYGLLEAGHNWIKGARAQADTFWCESTIYFKLNPVHNTIQAVRQGATGGHLQLSSVQTDIN